MICEKCGCEMQYFREYSTQGWKCPKCGWEVVTTYIDPMHEDETLYEIIISSDNAIDKGSIFLLKEVTHLTTPDALIILKSGNYIFYKGKAVDIMKKKKDLDSMGIRYVILPEFPWDKDDNKQ